MVAIQDQGPISLLLAEQTGLAIVEGTDSFDYLLGYSLDQHVLYEGPIDTLNKQHYLQLQPMDKTGGILLVDAIAGKMGYRTSAKRIWHEPLLRAVGAKPGHLPSIIDATAGFGTDAFLLASIGCEVILIEKDPLMAALLQDGIRRWQLAESVNIKLYVGQAETLIPTLASETFPEVIYLDPMFPERRKTAAVKKPMAFLQLWLPHDDNASDEMALLELAKTYAKKRIVIKRPIKAPYLANITPNGAINTKHHRYDIISTSTNHL